MTATAQPPGKIVTFYSYKGGTGRTMALANVAWILASNGLRVLVIDWDLEAPGLHRYLHPFLEDKELTATPGLIDYFVDVEVAARLGSNTDGTPWWKPWTTLIRYTTSLDFDFPEAGGIDFVAAGQQGPTYAERVSSFDWRRFYDVLGGGVLLEALKQTLRADYDYILIDSRTGISDTSGICTVQMPDDLVVCFTLNNQSVKGAFAAAESAFTQRLKPTGEPGLRVWPMATRIELAEKERLDTAREVARERFDRFVRHLSRSKRARYWERAEVLYQPFFAYEEVLAPFAERRQQTGSILGSMEALTAAFTDDRVTRLGDMNEKVRLEIYQRFALPRANKPTTRGARTIYFSYPSRFKEPAYKLASDLQTRGATLFIDRDRLRLGDDTMRVMRAGLEASSAVLVCVGDGQMGPWQRQEIETALALGKRTIPVVIGGAAGFDAVPDSLRHLHGIDLRDASYDRNLGSLVVGLEQFAVQPEVAANPDDPQKGRWGGVASTGTRRLSASVELMSGDWYRVTLVVEGLGGPALEGEVEFHLHPSFKRPVIARPVVNDRAELVFAGWGAFTVGVICDNGATTLELDLAEDASFPEKFRER